MVSFMLEYAQASAKRNFTSFSNRQSGSRAALRVDVLSSLCASVNRIRICSERSAEYETENLTVDTRAESMPQWNRDDSEVCIYSLHLLISIPSHEPLNNISINTFE